ncbi:uncharacterized protein [Cherax quadricarinatus]|uniref:uncharacterized protein n=1 Tax=Cherax quadricarinatus TaxID=27406 RepID=UPI00387EA51E
MTDEAGCIVKHIEQNQTSAKYRFKDGELVLGFLPEKSIDQVLSGINFTIYKNLEEAILSANVQILNFSSVACYKNNKLTESSEIKKFASDKYFEWQHIHLSVSNKTLIINGTNVVCSKTLLDDKSSYITVTPTRGPIYLVHNCHEACPVFLNSITVKKTSFNVSMVNTTSEKEMNMTTHINWSNNTKNKDTHIIPSSLDSFWHQLHVELNHTHITLKVGDSTMNYKVDNTKVILTGNSVAWVVNCDPGTLKDTWKQYYSDINKDSGDISSSKWLAPSIIIILVLLLILILVLWFRKLPGKRWNKVIYRASSGHICLESINSRTNPSHLSNSEDMGGISLEAAPPPGHVLTPVLPTMRLPEPLPPTVLLTMRPSDPLPPTVLPTMRPPEPLPPTVLPTMRPRDPLPPAMEESKYAKLMDDNQEEHLYCYVDLEALQNELKKEKKTCKNKREKGKKEYTRNKGDGGNEDENNEESNKMNLYRHDSENSLYGKYK